MRSPADWRTRLAEIITAGIQAGDRLQKTLQEERRALERQDSGALGAATADKQRSVNELEALEEERRGVCMACGTDPGPEHMPTLIAECGADDSIVRGWHELLSLAAHCRELNAINGAVIRLRRRQFASALCIVRGNPAELIETYGPTGGDLTPRTSRSLAEI